MASTLKLAANSHLNFFGKRKDLPNDFAKKCQDLGNTLFLSEPFH